jgi:hypothetical protein
MALRGTLWAGFLGLTAQLLLALALRSLAQSLGSEPKAKLALGAAFCQLACALAMLAAIGIQRPHTQLSVLVLAMSTALAASLLAAGVSYRLIRDVQEYT